jgi:hypothetical protein
MVKNNKESASWYFGVSPLRAALFIFTFLFLFSILGIAIPDKAQAIPAFARIYKTECTSCHTIFPQRNEFGEAFEKNGYVWLGPKLQAAGKIAAQTEEERKANEALLLTGLPPILPVSVELTHDIAYDKKAETHYNFKPFEVEFLAAGAVGDKIGFFMNEVIASSEAPGETELEEAFLVWRRAFDTPIDIKGGKLRPDVSIWKSNNKLIEEKRAPLAYTVDGLALKDPQNGIELNAVLGARFYVAGGVLDRIIGTDSVTAIDKSAKEYYGHASYKIGGADYHGKEPEVDFGKDTIWDYLSVTLSAFGYSGETLDNTDNMTHSFHRAGLEAGVQYKKLSLMLGGVTGENKYSVDPTKKSAASSAELDYQFTSTLIGLVRYDVVAVDGQRTKTSVVPAVVYAHLQSARVLLSAHSEKADKNNTTGLLRVQIIF